MNSTTTIRGADTRQTMAVLNPMLAYLGKPSSSASCCRVESGCYNMCHRSAAADSKFLPRPSSRTTADCLHLDFPSAEDCRPNTLGMEMLLQLFQKNQSLLNQHEPRMHLHTPSGFLARKTLRQLLLLHPGRARTLMP